LSAAIERRRDLAARRPAIRASSQAALTAALAEASPITCYSLTRGTGELLLDEKGSLHFRADAKIPWRGWPPKPLRRRSQAERSVTISRDQIRVAVPFDHLAAGPSVVIGYNAPGNGLSWDEFILATSPQAGTDKERWPQPTGDALMWARALAPGEGSPELRQEAARYRKRLRRRMSLFFWKLITLAVTPFLVLVFGLLAFGLSYEKSGSAVVALAVGVVWLAFELLSGIIILAVNR
jgi:hypothetical protein